MTGCPWCVKAKALLRKRHVPYIEMVNSPKVKSFPALKVPGRTKMLQGYDKIAAYLALF